MGNFIYANDIKLLDPNNPIDAYVVVLRRSKPKPMILVDAVYTSKIVAQQHADLLSSSPDYKKVTITVEEIKAVGSFGDIRRQLNLNPDNVIIGETKELPQILIKLKSVIF